MGQGEAKPLDMMWCKRVDVNFRASPAMSVAVLLFVDGEQAPEAGAHAMSFPCRCPQTAVWIDQPCSCHQWL